MAKHQMEVSCGGNTIPTTSNPKYLGVTLDRSLTYTKHPISALDESQCSVQFTSTIGWYKVGSTL